MRITILRTGTASLARIRRLVLILLVISTSVAAAGKGHKPRKKRPRPKEATGSTATGGTTTKEPAGTTTKEPADSSSAKDDAAGVATDDGDGASARDDTSDTSTRDDTGSTSTRERSSDFSTKELAGGIAIKASTEMAGYGDTDHVYVASPAIAASFSDELAGWSLSGHYLVDVVSAASVDIVSTASSKWLEYRHVGSAEGSMKLGGASMGASGVVSSEPDYLSLAGAWSLTFDLADKNVTPFISISYGHDSVGRTGLPHEFWRSKQTLAGKLGVTFTVDRATIASLQADAIEETGYLAKPYRYVPLFAPGQGASVGPGASIGEVNATRLDQRTTEQLPNKRHRFAVTGRLAHRYTSTTLRLDERAYGDSWGLLASTTDFRWMADVGRRFVVWPHLRLHGQNQAVFWQRTYEAIPSPDGSLGIPGIRTGDREISPLATATGGFGVRFKLIDDLRKPWSIVFEVDGSYTRYFDALYISQRKAVFSTLAVEAEF